jgi:hypothetical protein
MLERPGFAYTGGINYLSLQVLDPFVFQLGVSRSIKSGCLHSSMQSPIVCLMLRYLFWHMISFTHTQI